MADTAYTETAAIRLDGALADSTTIRFADEEVNAAPPGSKESIACAIICLAAVAAVDNPFCAVACIAE